MTTRGALVAGGRGERLGLGLPKALVVVGGATLLERAVATLARLCDEIVIATPATMELPVPEPRRAPATAASGGNRAASVPVRRVADREPGGGPLAGIVAALEDEGFDRAVVLGVDFPRATPGALNALLERLGGDGAPPVVAAAPGGRLQPLFAAYARAAVRPLREAFDGGERSVVRAVARLQPEVLGTGALAALPGGLDGFLNLNTPEDLAAANVGLARTRPRP